ncbi:hypothetical protein CsSME_00034126 [Camellia sinensis var. sinensis]
MDCCSCFTLYAAAGSSDQIGFWVYIHCMHNPLSSNAWQIVCLCFVISYFSMFNYSQGGPKTHLSSKCTSSVCFNSLLPTHNISTLFLDILLFLKMNLNSITSSAFEE